MSSQGQRSRETTRGAWVDRAHALWRWLLVVYTDDPVRGALNRGLVLVILALFLLALVLAAAMLIFGDSNWPVVFWALPMLFVAGWFNRRGSTAGAAILALLAVVGNAVGFAPTAYANTLPTIHVNFVIGIAIATLFIRPVAGFVVALGQIIALSIAAQLNGIPSTQILAFVSVAAANLGAIAAILFVGASIFQQALRRSIDLNEHLEQRVEERTQQLAAANVALRRAKLRIEQSARDRADWVAKLGHDLRHYINDVDIAMETLLIDAQLLGLSRETLAESQRLVAASLHAQNEMLEEMLDIARLDHDALTLRLEAVSLPMITEHVAEVLQGRFASHGCQLTIAPAPADLPLGYGDQQRLIRVLRNILINALTYTSAYHQGAHGARVCVHLSADDSGVHWIVCDNGPGIAPEILERLNEPFNTTGGTCLGLHFCYRVMALHPGGALRISSAGTGSGTTVDIQVARYPDGTDERAA